jgi:hypothetical protein
MSHNTAAHYSYLLGHATKAFIKAIVVIHDRCMRKQVRVTWTPNLCCLTRDRIYVPTVNLADMNAHRKVRGTKLYGSIVTTCTQVSPTATRNDPTKDAQPAVTPAGHPHTVTLTSDPGYMVRAVGWHSCVFSLYTTCVRLTSGNTLSPYSLPPTDRQQAPHHP